MAAHRNRNSSPMMVPVNLDLFGTDVSAGNECKWINDEVTGVTAAGIEESINDAVDPQETPPPEGLKENHPFPGMDERPRRLSDFPAGANKIGEPAPHPVEPP